MIKIVIVPTIFGSSFLKPVLNSVTFSKQKLGSLSPIQDGHFWGCSQMWGAKRPPLKICHTYPTMMKLGTVIPYLKKFQKLYESRDTPPNFC